MNFKQVLNELKISKFLDLYKKDDKRIEDPRFARNITGENGEELSFIDARHEIRKTGVTITPELETLLKDLTSGAAAKKDFKEVETQRRKDIRGKMKGGAVAKSRGYI